MEFHPRQVFPPPPPPSHPEGPRCPLARKSTTIDNSHPRQAELELRSASARRPLRRASRRCCESHPEPIPRPGVCHRAVSGSRAGQQPDSTMPAIIPPARGIEKSAASVGLGSVVTICTRVRETKAESCQNALAFWRRKTLIFSRCPRSRCCEECTGVEPPIAW